MTPEAQLAAVVDAGRGAPPKPAVVTGVSVVIPALNEAEAITLQVTSIREVLARGTTPWEIVVVDDGSTDETGALAEKAGAIVVKNPANAGYGASLKAGIQVARHDYIMICDADGTYPVDRI